MLGLTVYFICWNSLNFWNSLIHYQMAHFFNLHHNDRCKISKCTYYLNVKYFILANWIMHSSLLLTINILFVISNCLVQVDFKLRQSYTMPYTWQDSPGKICTEILNRKIVIIHSSLYKKPNYLFHDLFVEDFGVGNFRLKKLIPWIIRKSTCKKDCRTAIDEQNCETCQGKSSWKCKTSLECIMEDQVCNGKWDCSDGSDEQSCDAFCCSTLEINGLNFEMQNGTASSRSTWKLSDEVLTLSEG